ncbi:MAG: O-antigen ligase family protein [Chlorobi bacterium CHB2]|nr:O-antigen ligase family protein [Chlorobi bacterium CHB2]
MLDILMLAIPFFAIIRRLMRGHLTVYRSPLSRPVLTFGIFCGIIPMVRMFVVEQAFRFSWEVFAVPLTVFCFFMWLIVFEPDDLYLMAWILMIGGFYKSFEAGVIYLNVGVLWGLLTGWGDAMILALMVVGAIAAYAVKPADDSFYRRIRSTLLVTLPFTGIMFMMCLRRSYLIGVFIAIGVVMIAMNRRERQAAKKVVVATLVLFMVGVVGIGVDSFVERISGIAEPGKEGSSAYRAIEVYNLSAMLMENPWYGYRYGEKIKNHTILEYENISQLVPHNAYLYVWLRGGIVGLIAWIWVLSAMVAMHRRTVKAATQPFHRFVALWLYSSTVILIFSGLFTPVFAERLQQLYPFIMVMTSYLPGAWKPRRFLSGNHGNHTVRLGLPVSNATAAGS